MIPKHILVLCSLGLLGGAPAAVSELAPARGPKEFYYGDDPIIVSAGASRKIDESGVSVVVQSKKIGGSTQKGTLHFNGDNSKIFVDGGIAFIGGRNNQIFVRSWGKAKVKGSGHTYYEAGFLSSPGDVEYSSLVTGVRLSVKRGQSSDEVMVFKPGNGGLASEATPPRAVEGSPEPPSPAKPVEAPTPPLPERLMPEVNPPAPVPIKPPPTPPADPPVPIPDPPDPPDPTTVALPDPNITTPAPPEPAPIPKVVEVIPPEPSPLPERNVPTPVLPEPTPEPKVVEVIPPEPSPLPEPNVPTPVPPDPAPVPEVVEKIPPEPSPPLVVVEPPVVKMPEVRPPAPLEGGEPSGTEPGEPAVEVKLPPDSRPLPELAKMEDAKPPEEEPSSLEKMVRSIVPIRAQLNLPFAEFRPPVAAEGDDPLIGEWKFTGAETTDALVRTLSPDVTGTLYLYGDGTALIDAVVKIGTLEVPRVGAFAWASDETTVTLGAGSNGASRLERDKASASQQVFTVREDGKPELSIIMERR